ncbi:MAG TPA: hypothetical protein VMO20_05815 [Candidatus Acidoferrum sp.]|nr:hypothetical protein [Candidatus Acidoferrum sp.]
MNVAPAEPPVKKWTWTRWLTLIAFVFVFHVALIFIFGAHKPVPPMQVKNAPSLTLTGESADNLLGLNNATLFALPSGNGFSGPMWIPYPPLPVRPPNWTEEPHWLAATNPLPVKALGATFHHFMQTNQFASVSFEFNQSPPLTVPVFTPEPLMAQTSTLQIEGALVKRPLLHPIQLPSWPFADVIAPSVVQVLVDAAGNVISAALLPPENLLQPSAVRESVEPSAVRDPDADARAVELARNARFAPLSPNAGSVASNLLGRLAVGQLIFNWQAVPVTNTNASP